MSCRYVLVTPLVNREWGQAVLVNRGWVPAEWKLDAQLRASGCPAGKVRAAPPNASQPSLKCVSADARHCHFRGVLCCCVSCLAFRYICSSAESGASLSR